MRTSAPDTWDVLVVGAGPAGSMAARHAALGGARTLLLERRREVGVPVQCGEFLPAMAELERFLPHAVHFLEFFETAEPFVRARTHRLRVLSPAGRRYEVPFEGLVLDRDRFDRALAEAAVAAGAELRTGTRVTGLRGDLVETTRGAVRARVVVGADGPRSIVAREAGFDPLPPPVASGVQYLVRGLACDGDAVEMRFGRDAPGGYAWVIPKGDGLANVGVGVRPAPKRAQMRRRLDAFVETLEAEQGRRAERGRFTAGRIPVGGARSRLVRGNALLAGDAAGHVMPCNGGGVPTAMICGRLAGEVAAGHVRDSLPLSVYDRRWRTAVGRELGRAVTTRRIFDAVGRWRGLTELAMRVAGERGIRKLVTCRPWYRAGLRV